MSAQHDGTAGPTRQRATCSRPACTYVMKMRGLCAKHYRADLDERKARGEFIPGQVDPTAARAHVQALRSLGLGYRRIGELAGLHGDAVRAACTKFTLINAQTEAKLLAVPIPATPHQVAYGGTRVPPHGTVRRLQALVAIGHTQREISHKLGVNETNLESLINAKQVVVTAERARQVEHVYDAMSTAPGFSIRSFRKAQRLGWAPPMAWEGLDIDDPAAVPPPWRCKPRGKTSRLPKDWVDMLLDWRRLGRSDQDIADALGIELESLMRRIDRAGLPRSLGRPTSEPLGTIRHGVLPEWTSRGRDNRRTRALITKGI